MSTLFWNVLFPTLFPHYVGGRNQAEKMHPANYHSIIREEGKPVAADKIFLLLHSTTSIWHKISEKRQTLLCHTLLFLFFCSFSEWWSFRHSPFPRKKVTKKMFLFVLLQTERKPLTVRIFPQRQEELDKTFSLFVLLLFFSNQGYQPPEPQTFRTYNGSREAWKGKGWTNLKHFLLSLWSPLATEIPSA